MEVSKSNKKNKEKLYSLLILLPSILLVGIFVYGFVGTTIWTSLTDWGEGAGLALNPVKNFVGLKNYKTLFYSFTQSGFRQDLVNTIFYTLLLLFGTLFLGLFLAILLDRKVKKEGLYRTIFLYPMALSFIVSGTIWRWLLAPSGGLNQIPTWFGGKQSQFLWISSQKQILQFNWQNIWQVLGAIGLIFSIIVLLINIKREYKRKIIIWSCVAFFFALFAFVISPLFPPVIQSEETHGLNLAIIGIIIAGIWQYSGYAMALYLAGLRGLSGSIKESAKLDGANEAVYYFKIAIPNLKPITLSAVVIMAHISLKMFDLIYAMAGADNGFTGHPSVRMYLTTFRANKFALGAAMAVILFFLAACFIIPYMVNSHKSRRPGK
ncbi:MAG: sugar ABC transporter permease [Candidatus Paceibacterota bacterium]